MFSSRDRAQRKNRHTQHAQQRVSHPYATKERLSITQGLAAELELFASTPYKDSRPSFPRLPTEPSSHVTGITWLELR